MKKVFLAFVLLLGFAVLAQAQSKSGYRIQGGKPGKSSSKGSSRGGSDWMDNIFIQPNFGLAFSSQSLYINVSPTVGYKITEGLVAGVGASYIYSKYTVPNTPSFSSNTWGGNVFARYVVYEPFFLITQYEFMSTKWDAFYQDQKYDAFLAGGGIIQPMGRNGAFILSVMYNFNYDSDPTKVGENGPYFSPYVINAGVMLGF